MALLKEASEMFEETGCVPGIDGEQVPAQTVVRTRRNTSQRQLTTRKQSTTLRYGIRLGLRWSCRGLHWNGNEDVRSSPPRSSNPEQQLTKEQQGHVSTPLQRSW